MKRITYVSNFSRILTSEDIKNLETVSQVNNLKNRITGILLSCSGIFFQILEGDSDCVDILFAKILKDDRHTQVLCLKVELNIAQRYFPNWSMKVIVLDESNDILLKPFQVLLQTLNESKMALAKYTHSGILQAIENGINPLTLTPRYAEKIIFFADIMSFTSITEKLQVTEVVELLNQFFTVCTTEITAKGGEVTKFIGDCVMAYFDGDRADEALQASLNILAKLEILRDQSPANSPLKILYVGIGLSKGTVLEGNIGSQTKKEYTIIGDAVNVAAKIESLTRKLNRFLVFSAAVREGINNQWKLLKIGDFYAEGREAIVEVYSIDDPLACQKSDFDGLKQEIKMYLERIGKQTTEHSKQRKTLFMLYDQP